MPWIARIKNPIFPLETWMGFIGPFDSSEAGVEWIELQGFKKIDVKEQPYWTIERDVYFEFDWESFTIKRPLIFFEQLEPPSALKKIS